MVDTHKYTYREGDHLANLIGKIKLKEATLGMETAETKM